MRSLPARLLIAMLVLLTACVHPVGVQATPEGKAATADNVLSGLSTFLGARDAIAMSLGFFGVDMSWMARPEACLAMESVRAGAESGRRGVGQYRELGRAVMPGGEIDFGACPGARGPIDLSLYLIVDGTVDQQVGILEAAKVYETDPMGYAWACANLQHTRQIAIGAAAAWERGDSKFRWLDTDVEVDSCRAIVLARAAAIRDGAR